jgi:type IV pilus assembly protein PilA
MWFRNFERFECRAKQSEAKTNLRALHTAEEAYRGEHGAYGTLEEIGFAPEGDTVRYEYVLLEHGADTFVAEATGRDEMAGDRWIVDQSGHVDVVESRCGPVPRRPPPPSEDGESGVIEVAY